MDSLETEFDRTVPFYGRLAEEVCFALSEAFKSRSLTVHSVTSRIKAKDSFLEKATRKNYANPMFEIDDIAGVRVVCLFLSELRIV